MTQQVRFPCVGVYNLRTDSRDGMQEFDYYLSQFDRRMHGPLNYYRTTLHRYNEEHGKFNEFPFVRSLTSFVVADGSLLPAPRPDLPVLLIIGKNDPTSNQGALDITRKLVPHAQIELIDGVGHWLMVEARDYITEVVPQFARTASTRDVHTKL